MEPSETPCGDVGICTTSPPRQPSPGCFEFELSQTRRSEASRSGIKIEPLRKKKKKYIYKKKKGKLSHRNPIAGNRHERAGSSAGLSQTTGPGMLLRK